MGLIKDGNGSSSEGRTDGGTRDFGSNGQNGDRPTGSNRDHNTSSVSSLTGGSSRDHDPQPVSKPQPVLTQAQQEGLVDGSKTAGYGVGLYSGDRAAEFTYRDLYQSQYQDWLNRYKPYQDKLLQIADNKALLDKRLRHISANVTRNQRLAAEAADLARSRYGIQQSAEQAAQFNNNLGLQASLAHVSGAAGARLAAFDRYNAVMAGGGLGYERPEDVSTGGASYAS